MLLFCFNTLARVAFAHDDESNYKFETTTCQKSHKRTVMNMEEVSEMAEVKEDMVYYFAYGSNMNPKVRHDLWKCASGRWSDG